MALFIFLVVSIFLLKRLDKCIRDKGRGCFWPSPLLTSAVVAGVAVGVSTSWYNYYDAGRVVSDLLRYPWFALHMALEHYGVLVPVILGVLLWLIVIVQRAINFYEGSEGRGLSGLSFVNWVFMVPGVIVWGVNVVIGIPLWMLF